jgi:CDP-paratose 2-epimerase
VATLFLEFFQNPRAGEAYNLGGGRQNSLSILETVEMLKGMGLILEYEMREQNRIGDHICYISDLTKLRSHFPRWRQEYNLERIVTEMIDRYQPKKTR